MVSCRWQRTGLGELEMTKSICVLGLIGLTLAAHVASAGAVGESARRIPVAAEVDVVVVGGTIGAVAAAVEAAERDAKVLLIAPRNYLGEDICGSLRLWLEDGETADSDLAKTIFGDRRTTTPLKVKQVLERALLDSNVRFLLGCYATDVLVDGDGQPAGIVMANRAGRQAVVAKVIVDATRSGAVALMAGAREKLRGSGPSKVQRVVLGGEPHRRSSPYGAFQPVSNTGEPGCSTMSTPWNWTWDVAILPPWPRRNRRHAT